MKSKFMKSPEGTVFTLFVVTIFVVTYILRIFEVYYSIYPRTDNSIPIDSQVFNLVYMVIITISTVGYGDIYPKSIPGKVVMMTTAMWGAIMMALIVVSLSKIFEMNDN